MILKPLLNKNPADKAIRTELQLCKEERKIFNKDQQNVFQKFFTEGVYNEKKSELTKIYEELPPYNPLNPKWFMDISIGDSEPQRIIFELFADKLPKTAENFRCLWTGEKSTSTEKLHYKGSIFHRIISKFIALGGDFENSNGLGGWSIYGRFFNDEKIWLPHLTEGLLSMANKGENSNNSQFFITFAKAPWLNTKNTVFGRIIKGISILDELDKIETGANDKPLTPVKIVDWGQILEEIPENELELEYTLNESEKEVPEESKREI